MFLGPSRRTGQLELKDVWNITIERVGHSPREVFRLGAKVTRIMGFHPENGAADGQEMSSGEEGESGMDWRTVQNSR
jgi:hypothetical protein